MLDIEQADIYSYQMKSDNRNTLARLFVPRYNELTLFQMSITFILIFLTHADFRDDVKNYFVDGFDLRIIIVLVLFILGLRFSLYHVFLTGPKSDWENHEKPRGTL